MNRRNFLKINSLLLLSSPFLFAKPFHNESISNDIFVSTDQIQIFNNLLFKIKKLKKLVGYGNFNLISLDEGLKTLKKYGFKVTFEELSLFEELFFENPEKYGFYGKRTNNNINLKINKKDITKISNTGHYLFKGTSYNKYKQMIKDVGDSLILTSGIRNVFKQTDLYMSKIKRCNYNISLASISLTPPGYTYHSISDFDVGKKGYGFKNFSKEFIYTNEFKKIITLNYIQIRYGKNNLDGIKFEPWHIKIS